MNHPITTTLSQHWYLFLKQEAQKKKVTCKSILEDALQIYKKNQLEKNIEKGLKERYAEYQSMNSESHKAQVSSLIE